MACAFIHANGRVIFTRNPRRPRPELEVLQPEEQTAGGVRVGYDPVATVETLPLSWSNMPGKEYAQLLVFKRDVAIGSSNPFTYLDNKGNQASMRFAEAEIAATENEHDTWTVDVLLEKA